MNVWVAIGYDGGKETEINEIVLTENQTRFIENSQEPLVIRDACGNEVTRIDL